MSTEAPPYIRIAQRLRDEIVGGVIKPGDRLPSTRELIKSEKVARNTVDKAMKRLRESGLVETVPGIGLVAVDHKRVDSPRDMFLRTVGLGPGMRLANEKSEFLRAGYEASCPERVAELLGIEPFSRTVCRSRLIRRSKTPVYIATSWMPEWIGEAAPKLLVPESIPEGTARYIGETTGRYLRRGQDRLQVQKAGEPFIVDHLRIPMDEPTMYVETKWFDDQSDVLEVGIYHVIAGREFAYDYELGESPS